MHKAKFDPRLFSEFAFTFLEKVQNTNIGKITYNHYFTSFFLRINLFKKRSVRLVLNEIQMTSEKRSIFVSTIQGPQQKMPLI